MLASSKRYDNVGHFKIHSGNFIAVFSTLAAQLNFTQQPYAVFYFFARTVDVMTISWKKVRNVIIFPGFWSQEKNMIFWNIYFTIKWPTPLDSLRKNSQDRVIVGYNRTISGDFRAFSAFYLDVLIRADYGWHAGQEVRRGYVKNRNFFYCIFSILKRYPIT